MSAADLLSLLQGGPSTRSSAGESNAFDQLWKDITAKQAAPQPSAPARPSQNLLDLLKPAASPEPVAARPNSDQGNALLNALMRASPAIEKEPAPAMNQLPIEPATDPIVPQNKPSPFTFTSAFDLLAQATAPNYSFAQPKPSSPAPAASHQDKAGALPPAAATPPKASKTNPVKPSSKSAKVPPASSSKVIEEKPANKPITILQRPKDRAVSTSSSTANSGAEDNSTADSTAQVDLKSVSNDNALSWHVAAQRRNQGKTVDSFQSASAIFKPVGKDLYNAGFGVDYVDLEKTSFDDFVYTPEVKVTPVTLFATREEYQTGRRVALHGQLLTYATKQGRLRVLDRTTGARILIKHHSAWITDLCMGFASRKEDRALDSHKIIIAADVDGNVSVWRVPSQLKDDSVVAENVFTLRLSGDYVTALASIGRAEYDEDKFIIGTKAGHVAAFEIAKVTKPGQTIHISGSLKALSTSAGMTWRPAKCSSVLKIIDDSEMDNKIYILGTNKLCVVPGEYGMGDEWKVHHMFKEDAQPFDLALLGYGYNKYPVVSFDRGSEIRFYDSVRFPDHDLDEIPILTLALPSDAGTDRRMATTPDGYTLSVMDTTKGSITMLKTVYKEKNHVATIKIEAVLEIPTTSRIIDAFCPPEYTPEAASLFVLSPANISQIHIPQSAFSIQQSSSSQSGQLSVANAQISAPSVEAPLQAPALEAELSSDAPRRLSLENAIKVEVSSVTSALTVDSPPASPKLPPISPLPAPKTRPFVNYTDSPSAQFKAAQIDLDATDAKVVSSNPAQSAPGLDLVQRVEAALTTFMSVQGERSQQDKLAEISRQEGLLSLVSSTLNTQTSKALDASVRSEIRESLLPEISKIVRESIDKDISQTLRSTLQKTISDTLGVFFNRPDITNHMIRSFSTSASPVMDRSVRDAVSSIIVPSFQQSVQQLTTMLTKEMRQEILSVKKEMESEQSFAIAELADHVRILSDTVARLQSVPLPSQANVNGSSPAVSSSDNIPAAEYEDRLLTALSGSEPPQILHRLIESTSLAKLDEVFYGNHGRPYLTSAVLLSLTHRLSQALPEGTGPLHPTERMSLSWLTHCIMQMDFRDQTTGPYLERILQLVSSALNQTVPRLSRVEDWTGLRLIRSLEQLIPSRQ